MNVIDFKKLLEEHEKKKSEPQIPELWISTCQMSRIGRTVHKKDAYTYFDVVTNGLFIDTTTRAKHPLFAPGWDIVMGHKDGTVSDEEYTAKYLERMRESYRTHKDEWIDLMLAAAGQEHRLILVCYCTPGKFCHRHLLADVLVKIANSIELPVRKMGEWR